MSISLEEAILHAEEAASDYEGMIEDSWLDSEKLAKCANEQRQIAEWLRELAERREQSEIIHCGECKHYKIDHPKANGYHCCYRCHNIFPMKETDFCSKAERRTDG